MPAAIVWFRDDSRLDDHLALAAALDFIARGEAPAGGSGPVEAQAALVTVLDPRRWDVGFHGLPRLGPARARFWMESIAALRSAVRARGGELLVRVGRAEKELTDLARTLGATRVFVEAHVACDEVAEESRVEAALASIGARLERCPGRTLYPPSALPFPGDRLPESFSQFRRRVESGAAPAAPRDAPARLPPPPPVGPGDIPDPASLASGDQSGAIIEFSGGEAAGRARLEAWAFEADALGRYHETRNGMLHANDSSKLSPWLAHGCLSPRRVVSEVRRYERERGASKSTYWLLFELLWRDYFQLLALGAGARLFQRSGMARRRIPAALDRRRFDAWREGRTGFSLVDAGMRELAQTGFLSNRARQNVASFLAKTLGLDWRLGAAWFEATLVDYDPASNWGNWQYAAGVGTDPRDRVFDVVKQAFDYDPEGDYVRRFVPELAALEGGEVHLPWRASVESYPRPMVPPGRRWR